MEVEASIEPALVFAGNKIIASVEFRPPPKSSLKNAPILLSGYAAVQGSFRLGEMILSEPFAETKKAGTVLTRRGFDYGQQNTNNGLISGMLDGLRHLMVNANPSAGAASASTNSTQSSPHALGIGNSGRGDEGEYPIFSTAQVLLFTDLHFTEDEAPQKFRFAIDLPADLPPTYRSRSLYISYSLVVGFERLKFDSSSVNSRLQDTRLFLPFRLLPKPPTPQNPEPLKYDLREPINAPAPVLLDDNQQETTDLSDDDEDNMDKFVADLLKGNHGSRKARHRSSSLAQLPGAHYGKVSYDINRGSTPIAQLVLARPAITVGDILAGHIRFRRPCLHVSVYLELEEVIEEQYAALGSHRVAKTKPQPPKEDLEDAGDQDQADALISPKAAPPASSSDDEVVATTYTIYGREFQGVYGLSDFPIFLPTLSSVTPRVDTKQMTANWTLRIEFVGLAGAAFTNDDTNELLAKGQIDHETFSCRVPVIILPPINGGLNAAKTWRF